MKLLLLLTLLSSHVFAQSNITELKLLAEKTLESKPFAQKEHTKLSNYFSELSEFVASVKKSQKLKKDLNRKVSSRGLATYCEETLLQKSIWEEIIVNCTRNRFFLCSEDVRDYAQIKAGLKEQLDSEFSSVFDSTFECQ